MRRKGWREERGAERKKEREGKGSKAKGKGKGGVQINDIK